MQASSCRQTQSNGCPASSGKRSAVFSDWQAVDILTSLDSSLHHLKKALQGLAIRECRQALARAIQRAVEPRQAKRFP
jgi:hypothetical protein